MKKLIVIVGPTASGKSELGVKLARRFNGEIISADSRQVYKGLDIGTGKVTKTEMMGIPHHLCNVASPRRTFTAGEYQRRAQKALKGIFERGKTAFVVGGSPFYIYSFIDGWMFPRVKPNERLRQRREGQSTEELFSQLKKLDPVRARSIEPKNRRRLLRALEIISGTKKPVPPLKKSPLPYPVLFLGIRIGREELKRRIEQRFKKMLTRGLLKEVERLHKEKGIPWKKIQQFGFQYASVAQLLQGKISREQMEQRILQKTFDFARRQMAWFQKDKRIHWIANFKEACALVQSFLKSES